MCPITGSHTRLPFLQAKPVTRAEAEDIKSALVYMMETDYIYAFDVEGDKGGVRSRFSLLKQFV